LRWACHFFPTRISIGVYTRLKTRYIFARNRKVGDGDGLFVISPASALTVNAYNRRNAGCPLKKKW
jgi:hypothetical protein